MHGLLQAAKQLGSEAAKLNCHCEAKSFKGIIEFFENPLLQSHSIKKIAKFFIVRKFVKFLSLTKWKLFTNFVQISEIWMNSEPSPKFLSSL